MKLLWLVVLLVVGACDCSCERDWDVPYHVGKGRVVAGHLKTCLEGSDCSQISYDGCMADARAECLDAGLPKTCGYGEPEFTTYCRLHQPL